MSSSLKTENMSPKLVLLGSVVLVVRYVTVPSQGPLDENSHGTPAQPNNSQLKKVPLNREVKPT